MPRNFYHLKEYQKKQSEIMKENWKKGLFDCIRKREKRICAREGCGKLFEAKLSDIKIYCSSSCAATVNNVKRGKFSEATKLKISKALTGKISPRLGKILAPRILVTCGNPRCEKSFLRENYRLRKYCSNGCAMAVIGGKPTSPKASKGKGGIRKDISDTIYFYSRWEANFARLMSYLNIEWEYEPKTFDLKTQNYTPDFYLPEANVYIEIKNFLWKYSKIRDKKFRELYPNTNLILLLKESYLLLEKEYSHFIRNWEYKNSL
jgi:hypothetical protein